MTGSAIALVGDGAFPEWGLSGSWGLWKGTHPTRAAIALIT